MPRNTSTPQEIAQNVFVLRSFEEGGVVQTPPYHLPQQLNNWKNKDNLDGLHYEPKEGGVREVLSQHLPFQMAFV